MAAKHHTRVALGCKHKRDSAQVNKMHLRDSWRSATRSARLQTELDPSDLRGQHFPVGGPLGGERSREYHTTLTHIEDHKTHAHRAHALAYRSHRRRSRGGGCRRGGCFGRLRGARSPARSTVRQQLRRCTATHQEVGGRSAPSEQFGSAPGACRGGRCARGRHARIALRRELDLLGLKLLSAWERAPRVTQSIVWARTHRGRGTRTREGMAA